MLSAKEFKKLAERGDVYAALVNNYGERVVSGPIRYMVQRKNNLSVKWLFKKPESTYPYKYALILNDDGDIKAAYDFREFAGNTLEVVFD
jgi:hypothetical protein